MRKSSANSLSQGDRAKSLRRPRWLKSAGQDTGEGRAAQRPGDVVSSLQVFSMNSYEYEESTQDWGKNHLSRWRTMPGGHTAGNNPFLPVSAPMNYGLHNPRGIR
jgi:hypothetical protein